MRDNTVTNDRELAATQGRTRHINADYSECLAQPQRPGCIHAFLFGDGYLCTHPLHRELTTGPPAPPAAPKTTQVSCDNPDNS
jgi:hypothetical protein